VHHDLSSSSDRFATSKPSTPSIVSPHIHGARHESTSNENPRTPGTDALLPHPCDQVPASWMPTAGAPSSKMRNGQNNSPAPAAKNSAPPRGQSSPRLSFNATCSSISSARTSSLRWRLASNAVMRCWGLVNLGAGKSLEGGRAVLEQLLLPLVQQRWLNASLFADGGNWHLVQQVPAEDGNLLFRRKTLTLSGHGCSPLLQRRTLQFQLRQDKRDNNVEPTQTRNAKKAT